MRRYIASKHIFRKCTFLVDCRLPFGWSPWRQEFAQVCHTQASFNLTSYHSTEKGAFSSSYIYSKCRRKSGRTTGRDRRDEAIFTRPRVGHSRLNKTINVIGKCDRKASNKKVWLLPRNRDSGACTDTVWAVREGKSEAEIQYEGEGDTGHEFKSYWVERHQIVSNYLSFLRETWLVGRI